MWRAKSNHKPYAFFILKIFIKTLLLFSLLFPALAFAERSSLTFPQKLENAQSAAIHNERYKAQELFEALLREFPHEFVVYDIYAQRVEWWGNLRKAIGIYKRWQEINPQSETEPFSVSKRIEILEKKIEMEEVLKNAPSWEDAEVHRVSFFAVKQNLPESIAKPLLSEIENIAEQERQILAEAFGFPVQVKGLRIYMVAGLEDYLKFWRDYYGNTFEISDAFYNPEGKTVFIYGASANRGVLALVLAHHFILSYIENPSPFVIAGLSNYLSIHVAKEERVFGLQDWLQGIEYLDSIGELQSFWDWMKVKYLPTLTPVGRFSRNMAAMEFDARTWTAVYFFMQTEDTFFKEFFRQYLTHERGQKENTAMTMRNYFKTHLDEKKMQRLDDEWGKMTVNLTLDKI